MNFSIKFLNNLHSLPHASTRDTNKYMCVLYIYIKGDKKNHKCIFILELFPTIISRRSWVSFLGIYNETLYIERNNFELRAYYLRGECTFFYLISLEIRKLRSSALKVLLVTVSISSNIRLIIILYVYFFKCNNNNFATNSVCDIPNERHK